ncbi:carbamoyltransferase [Singulisphaera sp. GP187]|uniref:carbamoyltransferase family protein n=1 Tax=Singulisphaera sp. GP187 TaxID=1882752 RepID=UPI00092B6B55|nr:carbamoyltransferase [Singulisphaera sp. GP187]SIO31049.1 carbamoyltransferase [Singulisphaera sp. GP187]
MTAILGLSAFYHDSAAVVVVDGRIVAAAQEERFSRKKHDAGFPAGAVAYCLGEAGLTPADLDWVGFYDKPLLKFERLLETYIAYAPRGFRSFRRAMPVWLRTKLFLPKAMARGLGGYHRRFVFAEHHESHAASAFFPSPFEEAAILTVDGVGEWTTASFGMGQGHRIGLTHQLRFPHSLGLLYSALTYYTGFRVNSGEHKVMGLAPYGRPVYADLILKHLLDLKDDGSFRMDMSYFNYTHGLTMTSAKFHRLFGGPPRRPESPVTPREMDLAASLQAVTEEILLRMARHVHKATGAKQLCLAGGVALNCVANGRILREGPFEEIWIQPAAGDAGGALGIALFIEHQLLGHPRTPQPTDSQQGSLLGPAFSDATIERFLQEQGAEYTRYGSDEELCQAVAEALAGGQVVGWFQGRMEFGPRSLGARSLLGDPRNPEMQAVMNLKVKFRESFRPFGPAVLRDRAADLFDMRPEDESPYMLLTFAARPETELPAVTHVDRSARIQTVDPERNPLFHQLLRAFATQTSCPALINTSFNVRGEPVVCTPADAYRGFVATHIDLLALGRCVVRKAGQRPLTQAEVVAHLARFPLD